ncbi:MAG TPA: TRC40/GET3/ArsA family transport-energizing ATPase [Candidatus Dormibacteraeota bacterium]|nr:TRC40/GET3/ArsA family transport-energizing ATPase [Candidatus Dormibacteraeota bacterium]
MRVILYTGKGGVGKTSVAAATALMAAKQGMRTLIISTDPAHSVSDAFDVEGSSRRRELRKNLWIHEVDALTELEANWKQVHGYVTSLFASQGIDDILAEELSSPPGMGEVAALMWIRKYYIEEKYDLLVVDCAPTGETLQLLSFPEVARWWLKKVFPIERRVMKVARPMIQPLIDIPLPKDDFYASVKDLLLDLDGTRAILSDPKTTSMRLVLNLEKMVIKEAQRAYTYLNLYDYHTDAVIVNRVLPDSGTGRFFEGWQKAQWRYEEMVRHAFDPLPILEAPMFEQEVVGEEMLARLGEAIFADADPTALLQTSQPQRMERDGKDYVLCLDLPFVAKDEIDLVQRENELFVKVGPYKREISLPRVLARRQRRTARFDSSGRTLRIHFAEEERVGSR